jgi:hypothetical protein
MWISEVLTAVKMSVVLVFWVVTPCSEASGCQQFRVTLITTQKTTIEII